MQHQTHGPWCVFTDVHLVNAWLDHSNGDSSHEDSMRVLKLVEEAGEAASAYIGMTGQNPRKGFTHTRDDLVSELADVAIAALCAIAHFTDRHNDLAYTVSAKLQRIMERAGIPDHPF